MIENFKAPPGVSVVIVTYNGEHRLPATLDHLLRQEVDGTVSWEVVVVDNASTDDTAGVVRRAWVSDIPLRLVDEPAKGLAFVRIRGIEEARHEYVLFVDDDNRIAPDWVSRVYGIFSTRKEIGMLGGYNLADYESPPPVWFEHVKESYAIGPQGKETGDITCSGGYLWSAGMAFRRSVFLHFRDCGFKPLLTSRVDGKLKGGEDAELFCLFKAAGYSIWYFSDLVLTHYIPGRRLSLNYASELYKGNGENLFYLGLYTLAMSNSRWPLLRSWQISITEFIYVVLKYAGHSFNPPKKVLYRLLLYYSSSRLLTTVRNTMKFRSCYLQVSRLVDRIRQDRADE